MKKKLFALIVFILMVLIPSCAKDKIIKGDGDPDISKYIGGDVKNETTFDSNYYYPKFKIIVTKVPEIVILEYEIHYQYVFGQDWNVLFDKRIHYTPEDKEIQELNEKGYFIITGELEKVPVETKYDPSSYYGELNYNEIVAQDCYIKFRKNKRK